MSSLRPLTVLITDAQELAGMGAIRSLGRAGHSVVAGWPADMRRPAGAWSRHVAKRVQYPDPWRRQLAFREWLEERLLDGELDAVLPVTEAAIVATAALRECAPPRILLMLPDDNALRYTLSKVEATRQALKARVACPQTVSLEDPAPTSTKMEELSALGYPIVIKSDNSLDRSGVYRAGTTRIAREARRAEQILRDMERRGRRGLAQEYIPGRGAGGFFLRWGGRVWMSFTHRRLHEVPWTGGSSSLRESSRDESLLDEGKRVLDGIDYQGLAMVEFRKTSSGRAYFMEINGRLWGSLALALHCGVDFPLALLECHREGGPTRPVNDYPVGLRCRSLFPGELAYALSVHRKRVGPQGQAAPSRLRVAAELVLHTFHPKVKSDFFWWSDPSPGVMQMLEMGRQLIGKTAERLGGKVSQWRAQEKAERLRAQQRARLRRGTLRKIIPRRILFLCHGNICRSPFAEKWWNSRRTETGRAVPPAHSAGFHRQVGRPTPARIVDLAAKLGVALDDHRSRTVKQRMITEAGIVVVMDLFNWHEMTARFPDAVKKTFLAATFANTNSAEVGDPFNLEDEAALAEFEMLETALEGMWKTVLTEVEDLPHPANERGQLPAEAS